MSRAPIHITITPVINTRGLDEMATRAELEKENADLRARLARYEGKAAAAGPVSFGMSEGVRNDIEQAKTVMGSDDLDRPKEVVVHDGGTGATYRVYRDGADVAVEEYLEGDLTTMAPTAPGRTDDLPTE
jgi:ribosomal protein L29